MAEPPTAAITLASPLAGVRGIRKDRAEALSRLDIITVADLIKHLPMRYERQEAEATIADLKLGVIGSARGEVTATRIIPHGRKPRFEAVVVDHTGRLDVVWFNQTYLRNQIYPGVTVRVQGQPRKHGPGVQMANPKVQVIPALGEEPGAITASEGSARGRMNDQAAPLEARVRPVYPASEAITSVQIEGLVKVVLADALRQIEDHLSPDYRAKRSLPELREAYRMAHQPATLIEAREATRRLAYDELLLLQLGVFLRRSQLRITTRGDRLAWTPAIDRHIRDRFPFALTAAQERVVGEIVADLSGTGGELRIPPANRLIQGDVGSGKTVVALYAMLVAVANKRQAALMAPTELLAEQHYLSISRMLEGSGVRVELLLGAMSDADKRRTRARLASGDVDIAIGTHALLSEGVRFESLSVAVIDEQHRFGVEQRAALRQRGFTTEGTEGAEKDKEKKEKELTGRTADADGATIGIAHAASRAETASPDPASLSSAVSSVPSRGSPPLADWRVAPHVFVMTATPIPRTLALTIFGDLDVSVIDELPPGRTPIATRVVEAERSAAVYQYVRERLDAGEQAYIVVPLIDAGASSAGEGRDENLNDLRTVLARLEAHEFAGKRIAALHGGLKRATREAVMARFRAGAIDALVATTVIEVGVDVPNATVMVVEHAERFGLAQLHQLRGRVGRGPRKSLCVLLWSSGAMGEAPGTAQARLEAMAATTDGFVIAEKDYELRGFGEVFGKSQAGAPPFKVADLARDKELLRMARRDAQAWIERSPRLRDEGDALVRARLMRVHGAWLGLGEVG